MLKRFGVISGLLAFTAKAQPEMGFVNTLLKKSGGEIMKTNNLMEYYGRIENENAADILKEADANPSKAFLAMLMSYEYATQTIRFHFNMKEPAGEFYPEMDFQWNTHLDLKD